MVSLAKLNLIFPSLLLALLLSVFNNRFICAADTSSGWHYLEQRRYDEAIKSFREMVKMDPNNPQGYTGLGMVYSSMNNHEEALKWFKEAIRKDPNNGNNYNQIANIYKDMGRYNAMNNYDEALKWYHKALTINPRDSNTLLGIADSYRRKDDYTEALKWYRITLTINPGSIEAHEGIGKTYYQMKKYTDAIKWLNKAKKICVNCDQVNEFIARVYIAQRKYDKAESLLNSILYTRDIDYFKNKMWGCPFQALGELYSHMAISDQKRKVLDNYMKAAEIEPYKIGAQREAAEICYEYGDYGNAMKYIERAIYLERELNGDDTNHRITKGYILINMKKYKEAEDVFREIIKKKTDFYQTLAEVGIGHIEISRGNYKLAQKYFQKMLIGDGNDIMANLGMAWLNSNQNEHQKALIYYDVILKENPFYILALLGKGNALMGLKRISEAESLFKKVLQIDPENEYALAELGIVAYYKGDDNNAEQLFNKSLSKNNKTYTCPYEGLGLLYLEQGKLKEAETNFKKAIDINPRIEYKKYNGLARIYLKHGKIEEAKKLLKKSIQNYPYDNEAKELLKKID